MWINCKNSKVIFLWKFCLHSIEKKGISEKSFFAMSSSLSELRNFRLNKANASNGGSPSTKLATGRKRIRQMTDSSEDEQTAENMAKRAVAPISSSEAPAQQNQPTENGTAATAAEDEKKLSVKEKEERFHLFRNIVDKRIDSLVLQDFLVQNGWDVQNAYDALQESPKYKHLNEHSPQKSPLLQSTMPVTSSKSEHTPSEHTKSHNKHKVCNFHLNSFKILVRWLSNKMLIV